MILTSLKTLRKKEYQIQCCVYLASSSVLVLKYHTFKRKFIFGISNQVRVSASCGKKIPNRQLQRVIPPPCSLPIFALEILAFACPSNCQQGEATRNLAKGENSARLGHLLLSLLRAKTSLNPSEGQALFFRRLSVSLHHFLFWNSAITFPFLEEFS